jgi:prophage regulatory protein
MLTVRSDIDSFLRVSDVIVLVPVGRSTLWSWVRRGKFPRPIKLSARTTAWRRRDVVAWLNARVAEQRGEQH